MNAEQATSSDEGRSKGSKGQAYRVRLPGFVSDKEIGLGDVIKRATSYIGIRPCGGCDRRSETLNRWVVFRPW